MARCIRIGFITTDMHNFPTTGLYIITDSDRLDFSTLCQRTESILEAGVPVLQYRDKAADQATRRERALAIQDLCSQQDTLFLVNDDVQLARDIGADGVHIGQGDLPYLEARQLLGEQAIIGVSCYNRLDLALDAQSQGADYIAFGAFFSTRTKSQTTPAQPELLRRAKLELVIPIIAIGGITPHNAALLIETGADAVAVINGLFGQADPADAAHQYARLFHGMEQTRIFA